MQGGEAVLGMFIVASHSSFSYCFAKVQSFFHTSKFLTLDWGDFCTKFNYSWWSRLSISQHRSPCSCVCPVSKERMAIVDHILKRLQIYSILVADLLNSRCRFTQISLQNYSILPNWPNKSVTKSINYVSSFSFYLRLSMILFMENYLPYGQWVFDRTLKYLINNILRSLLGGGQL